MEGHTYMRKRTLTTIATIGAITIGTVVTRSAVAAEPVQSATTSSTVFVERVVDGDTIKITPEFMGADRVRILGIDTPEVHGTVECYGYEASQFAYDHLDSQTVTLTLDSVQPTHDRWGRVLAYVNIGDWDYSIAAAGAGVADTTDYPMDRRWDIDAAAGQAKHDGIGMWGVC